MNQGQTLFLLIVLGMLACFALMLLAAFLWLARPWLRAMLNGTPVPLVQILGMRFRRSPPLLLVDAYIELKRAGHPASIGDVELAYLDARNRIFTSDDLVEVVKSRERED